MHWVRSDAHSEVSWEKLLSPFYLSRSNPLIHMHLDVFIGFLLNYARFDVKLRIIVDITLLGSSKYIGRLDIQLESVGR